MEKHMKDENKTKTKKQKFDIEHENDAHYTEDEEFSEQTESYLNNINQDY